MRFLKKLGKRFKPLFKYWWIVLIPIGIILKPWEWFKDSLQTNDLYKAIAADLYYSMEEFGTAEERIFRLLEDLNGWELRKVYEAFGRERYFINGGIFGMGANLDLFAWFENELGEKDLNRMRIIWSRSDLEITF